MEQHIAVFGESGSGKTVLMTSWYGVARDIQTASDPLYKVKADNFDLGTKLFQSYLGMKEDSKAPPADRFKATDYSFLVEPRQADSPRATKNRKFDNLRLVWHDYPGEWFESAPHTATEQERRIETFQALLTSNVALLLIDAQKLLANAGQEERYLKSLFDNFERSLEDLEAALTKRGKLSTFPRVWVLGLSKADLIPDLDVCGFRDMLIKKAGREISALRSTIGRLINEPEALAFGEDFVLLSSARFTADAIDVATRKGVDLVLPMAEILPLTRLFDMLRARIMSPEMLAKLLGASLALIKDLVGRDQPIKIAKLANSPVGAFAEKILPKKLKPVAPVAAWLIGLGVDFLPNILDASNDQLERERDHARAKRDVVREITTEFRILLAQAETNKILIRGDK